MGEIIGRRLGGLVASGRATERSRRAARVSEIEAAIDLDPTSRLVLAEAARRGIEFELLDPRGEYFRLAHRGRAVLCRESLSERTNAVALSRCDDKRTTARFLGAAGLRTPQQVQAKRTSVDEEFLRRVGSVVVKPSRGEQGRGISVDVRDPAALSAAIDRATEVSRPVLLEEFVHGDDLRVVVIGYEVVAAAVRRPPQVMGDGESTLLALVERRSRQRELETDGASRIPIDDELRRCLGDAGLTLDDVLPRGRTITVRGAANVHQGGTIHDVTSRLHPDLVDVARRASRALDIPVVGLDLIVPDVEGPDYWILEANERPGLANHEPQPTAERFVDFLFPSTRVRTRRRRESRR